MELVNNIGLYTDTTLKAYYPLTGNSTDVKNAHNGTDTAITYGAAYGKYGQGALFNGTTSKIAIASHADFQPAGNMSVGAWVYSTAAAGDIMANYYYNFPGPAYGWLIATGGGVPTFYRYLGTGDYATAPCTDISATTDIRNAWHFVVCTYDTVEKGKIYVDGKLEGTDTTTGTCGYYSTQYVRIGCHYRTSIGADEAFLAGNLDEVFIFNNKVLTASEIQLLYNESGAAFLLNMI